MADFFGESILLSTEKVLLRPLSTEDLPALIAFSEQEPDLWKYSLVSPNTPAKMKAYLEQALREREQLSSYPFAVIERASGKLVGSTRFYDVQLHYQTTQLGYTWYGSDYQGTGINTHCKYLLLGFAFETLHLERIGFHADAKNDRSIAAMKKTGCTVEGLLRHHLPKEGGGRRDSVVLSILKDEWPAAKARLEQLL